MVRGYSDFQFSKNVICCKWFGNKAVLLLATNVEGMVGMSNMMRQTKGSFTKTPKASLGFIGPPQKNLGPPLIPKLQVSP